MGVYSPQYINIGSIASDIENSNVAFVKHLDDRRLYDHTATAPATNIGITPGKAEPVDKYLGKGTERNFDIPLFKNGEITCYGDESDKKMNVSGAVVDEKTLNAQNFKSGDSTSIKVTCSATRGNWAHTGKSDEKYSGTATLVLIYFDAAAQSRLSGLAGGEMSSPRLKAQYNVTGTSYADGLLTYQNIDDDATTPNVDEFKLRDSNYSKTAWIDEDENVYQDSQVTDIVTKNSCKDVILP
jgi:hypothetical protein